VNLDISAALHGTRLAQDSGMVNVMLGSRRACGRRIAVSVLLALQALVAASSDDPFSFLQPSVTVTPDDRSRLDRGTPVARTLPAQGDEVAVFAAVPVNIGADRLVAWMRRIEELKKSRYVLAIGRFSDPPRIEDLAALELDDDDLSAIRNCSPGRCGLKLSSAEMTQLTAAATQAGTNWKPALQQEFRRVVLARVTGYLAGHPVGPYDDSRDPISPDREAVKPIEHSAFLSAHFPGLVRDLARASNRPPSGVEAFLYWSKERLARRPVISVTDVRILRSNDPSLPEVLVTGKELFSTHYVNASLGLTALARGSPGGPNYLVYVNRSEVDVLHGVLAPIIRWAMQRRLRTEAAGVLQGIRRRLESGEPPVQGVL